MRATISYCNIWCRQRKIEQIVWFVIVELTPFWRVLCVILILDGDRKCSKHISQHVPVYVRTSIRTIFHFSFWLNWLIVLVPKIQKKKKYLHKMEKTVCTSAIPATFCSPLRSDASSKSMKHLSKHTQKKMEKFHRVLLLFLFWLFVHSDAS